MNTLTNRDRKGAGMNGVLLLLGLSVFINYIDRANLSVAAPLLRGELALSSSQLGIVLSAFFWTYACMQPVVGWMVDRFEVKWVFAIGFFLWSAATALTGVIHGFAVLLIMRVILGIGESVAYPAYSKIFATHFVESQRGVANSAIGAGQALGPGLGMLIGGMVVAMLGWRPFFIALGLVSLLWLLPWLRWMPRTPGCGAADMQTGPGLPEIVRQKSAWGTFIGLFCSNYFLYFLLTWLPLYLVEERHFSMHGMARIGGSAFLLAATSSLIFGRLSDRWIAAGTSATRVRKGCMILATTCIGLCMAGAVLAPPAVSVGLLLLGGASFGLISSNLNAITQTLAGPSAAGRWMGMQNFFGNMAGWVVPALTGFLVQRTGHYYWPFFITAAVAWIGALDWLFLVGAVEPVIWKTDLRSIVTEVSQMVGEPSIPTPHP
jgi:MFS transporter, ACS family, D-galactonate transporter